ncbi:hypothetical protein MPTK1_6g18630 [Marchantia polymorpha subsp. ruderalis]|uniref:Uncharacterized protein n=2 Tax=Marchantia polymorpha TaxID=3197 RepID=A0AAF6BTI1_MARPO|nr:hypothetical protein MARPO_0038s0073 [Marchantia polymorpha]BBN15315.1 hypothetical protein Mp_6g18630 [Marchantia polymorpha subsp. ruderalis]|eukprot:PTQ40748.1 hypothetical protein MARPO_0038s0073 [Marchantia polymorpha]
MRLLSSLLSDHVFRPLHSSRLWYILSPTNEMLFFQHETLVCFVTTGMMISEMKLESLDELQAVKAGPNRFGALRVA